MEERFEALTSGELEVRLAPRFRPPGGPREVAEEVRRILDPAAAEETLHWGRNYIYQAHLETTGGALPVAVKQFPGEGLKTRLRRRLSGSKAAKSWRVAHHLAAAGIATPEPVLIAESARPDGPTFYVSRLVEGVFEARYLFRAVNAGRRAELFPQVDLDLFLDTLGRTVRRLHEAGVWHRDLSSGNVLVRWPEDPGRPPDLYLVDLNRARVGGRLSAVRRTRDLARLMIFRPEHQERLLAAYWGDDARALARGRRLYRRGQHVFLARNETKKRLRGAWRSLRGLFVSRGTHPHIPPAPEGTAARDRAVWDPLSDQPHLHAGKWEKLRLHLADAGAHHEQAAAFLAALPRVRRRYRELTRGLYRREVPFAGAGVALRPWPEGQPAAAPHPELLAAVEELGARHLLLRLHPWEDDHRAEEALARELAARGYELTFSLPQNRELVRDLTAGGSRWRDAVAELAGRFAPYGRFFQVGQAVNRSKWGVWNCREWEKLTRIAAEELRRHPGVEVLGPAVIDFEFHQTMGLVNLKRAGFRFDALASLLYVDRRGAPENRQLGFDTVGKVVLMAAIAETAALTGPRSWITEVNWPLWEGPHSPAGKGVSVDEETQADYLVRFYLLALGTGLVERVFWWQMAARGYGLLAPPAAGGEGFRRRPAFRAFAHLLRRLDGAVSLGPLEAPASARLYPFRLPDGGELVVGWALPREGAEAELPRPAAAAWGRDGEELPPPPGPRVGLLPAPRYFLLE